MRPKCPFLLTASNALAKPGRLLKWKKRLVKDARLLLPFTEVMTSPILAVFADYLRAHFSISQPKALRSRARGYFSELRRATWPEESHSSSWSSFCPVEFLAAPSNLSLSTAIGPDKVVYPMLKHLPRSSMDFLLHILNLSFYLEGIFCYSHPKMGKSLDFPATFHPISLASCVSKLYERIILFRLLFFLESNSILSPSQAGFRPRRSTLN